MSRILALIPFQSAVGEAVLDGGDDPVEVAADLAGEVLEGSESAALG